MTKEEKTTRIGKNFGQELDEIKLELKKKGHKVKVSDRKITSLIPLHNYWRLMKEELVKKIIDPGFISDRKGISTIGLFGFVVIAMVIITVLGLWGYLFNLITTSISSAGMAGAVNLSNATADTLGQINTAFIDRLNVVGMFILFGMILAMFVNAYFTRDNFPRLFFVVDILLLIFAYILSVYVSNVYETILNVDILTSTFVGSLAGPSKFMLNLPTITTIVGIAIMIITYIGIPFTKQEGVFVGQR